MKKSAFKNTLTGDLLDYYASAARAYRHLAAERDYSGSAGEEAVLHEIYRELKTRGKDSQNSLLVLLDHDDPAIRRWAGAHALEFAPGLAKPVLQKLADGTGLLSSDAQTALREWRERKKLKDPSAIELPRKATAPRQ